VLQDPELSETVIGVVTRDERQPRIVASPRQILGACAGERAAASVVGFLALASDLGGSSLLGGCGLVGWPRR
jgi:hypothetical protein